MLINHLKHQRLLVDYVYVSAAAVLIYDYALTLHLEIKHIWFSRWSYATALFLLTRYTTFVITFMVLHDQMFMDASEASCKTRWKTTLWLMASRSLLAETILCVRTWAIWNRNKTVGRLLMATMFIYATVLCFFVDKFARSLQIVSPPYPSFRGCEIVHASRILWGQFASLFAVQIVVLTLVVISAYRLYRTGRNTELSFIIHRDGVLFYVYVLLITGANLAISLAAPLDLIALLSLFEDVLHSVFTTRIIFNIRSAASRGKDLELHTSYLETHGASPMQFVDFGHHLRDSVISDRLEDDDSDAEDSHHSSGVV